jgi:hypothetical protein
MYSGANEEKIFWTGLTGFTGLRRCEESGGSMLFELCFNPVNPVDPVQSPLLRLR